MKVFLQKVRNSEKASFHIARWSHTSAVFIAIFPRVLSKMHFSQ